LQGVVVDVSNRVQGNQVSYISLCPCVRVWRPCWFQPIRADPQASAQTVHISVFQQSESILIQLDAGRERRHGPALPSSLRHSFSAMGCREFPILTQQYRGREQLWHQIKQLIEQAHLRHTHNRFLFFLLHDSPRKQKSSSYLTGWLYFERQTNEENHTAYLLSLPTLR
jgi:hypothetical protein